MVDARHHYVGATVENVVHGELHAVYRRARHVVHPRATVVRERCDAERFVDGEGHRLARLGMLGTHGHDIADFDEAVDQRVHATRHV